MLDTAAAAAAGGLTSGREAASFGNLRQGKKKKKKEKATCRNRKGNLAVAAGDVREGDCFHMHTCKANIQSNVQHIVANS